jgi:hypothetical protein
MCGRILWEERTGRSSIPTEQEGKEEGNVSFQAAEIRLSFGWDSISFWNPLT